MGKFIFLLIFCMYFVLGNGRYYKGEENNVISDEDTTGSPVCYPPCQNDGICTASQICECPENFGGVFCEQKKIRECFSFEMEKEFCESYELEKMKQCDRFCYFNSSTGKDKIEVPTTQPDEITTISAKAFPGSTKEESLSPWDAVKKIEECSIEVPISENAITTLLNPGWQLKKYQVKCLLGFSFPDGSRYRFFECWANRWYGSGGALYIAQDCQKDAIVPEIETEEQNDEITSISNEGFTTPQNEIYTDTTPENIVLEDDETESRMMPNSDGSLLLFEVVKKCPFEPPISENSRHILLNPDRRWQLKKYKVVCFTGYSFPDGSTYKYFECMSGRWYNSGNGFYIAEDCQKDIITTSPKILESNGCPFEPPLSKNAKHIRLGSDSTTKYKVQCFSGFSFADGSTVQYLECKDDGKWHHQLSGAFEAPDCYENQPVIDENDVEITNDNIDIEKENTNREPFGCTFEPPLSENAKHILLDFGSTKKYKVQCFPGFSFADGSTVQYLECKGDGKWHHQLSGGFKALNCFKNYETSKNEINDQTTTENIHNEKSNEILEKLIFSENSKNNTNSLMELIKFALGVRSETQWNDTKESKFAYNLKENNDIPGVKVVSLNLQVVEIEGSSAKNKEKTLQ